MKKVFKIISVLLLFFIFFLGFAEEAKAMTVTYTSGSGNWISPMTGDITIECWGGGGAGGGQNQSSDGGGGGGGGAYAKINTYAVTKGSTYAYSVGSGGTGVASSKGDDGNPTTFVSTVCVSLGGTGGSPSTGTPPVGGAGGVGASGTGDVLYSGGQGEKGRNSNTGNGGYGGSSAGTAADGYSGPQTWDAVIYPMASTPTGAGDGGQGGSVGFNGASPYSGSGGGGGGSGSGTAKVGGAGTNGKIIITYADDTPPTVALNTLTNGATGQSTTPTLNFTGTDAAPYADDIEYNVQVDTVNSFNSVSVGFDLKYVDLSLAKVGHPTDNLLLDIRSTSFSGSSLGQSDAVAASSISGVKRFTFTTPITLSVNTKYYMTLSRSGARDIANCIEWGYDASSYSGGGESIKNYGSWDSESTTQNFYFVIYDTNTVAQITQNSMSSYYYIYGGSGTYEENGQSFTVSTVSPLLSKFSSILDAGFTAGHPFTSGTAIDYTVQAGDILTANTTYYWRVRAIDPLGTNTWGVWSSIYSFTTDFLDHYLVTIATPQTAGVCATGTNTVTAKDVSNSTITSDTSTVNMTNSGTGITFYTANDCSSTTTTYTMSSGVANIYYKTDIAQSFTITATKASSTETGTSSSITVDAGGPTPTPSPTPSPSPSPSPGPTPTPSSSAGVKIKGGSKIRGGMKVL